MTEDLALEKSNRVNLLFDFYESLLTEKQQTFIRYYFHDDYTLGEISALFGISRQAVYEHIKRAQSALEDYESKLHLMEKFHQRSELISQAENSLAQLQGLEVNEVKQQLVALLQQLNRLD